MCGGVSTMVVVCGGINYGGTTSSDSLLNTTVKVLYEVA